MDTAQQGRGKIDQHALLDQYLPMVRRQALALQVRLPACVELDDLIQAGMVGLLDCMNRYDAAQGASFMAYAGRRIRGAMIDELRSRDWVSRSVRRHAREIEETMRRIEQQLGRPAEEREIAEELSLSLEAYRRRLHATNSSQLLGFEDIVAVGGEPDAGDDAPKPPFDALASGEQRQRLVAAIEHLPEREKLLLGLYYQEELNLKEVGAVLGVSESRVCQLHSQAVARLRARLGNDA